MIISKQKKDPFGQAVSDYHSSWFLNRKKIIVHSSISGTESIDVRYLFRSIKRMPELERIALANCKGKTLDVGACAGSHSLELQKRGVNVTALEISELCCKTMQLRGVKEIICDDIFKYAGRKYDTIILLMNGIGLAGTIEGLTELLGHLKGLLEADGRILFDSSDIEYAYYEKDGSKWLDLNNSYYGQVKYTLEYKGQKGDEFNWLFIDKTKMKELAELVGFDFTVLADGDHYDYLGLLKPRK